MTLRSTFGEIIEMTRREARLSTNTSRGVDHLDYVKQIIVRNYTMLAEDFDWEHLRLRRGDAYKTVSAGQRYYDFPVNVNPMKIDSVWVRWGTQWEPVAFQITDSNYNALDSDADQRSDPVSHWDYYNASDGTFGFEVWPIPGTEGQLHFIGQKKVQALVQNSDRADLDDVMIALQSAAEILRDNKDEKTADRREAKALERRSQVRAMLSDKRRFSIGLMDPKMGNGGRRPREITYVR